MPETPNTAATIAPPPSPPHPNPPDANGWLLSPSRPFSVEVCPGRPLDLARLALLAPRMCSVTWHARTVAEGMAAVRLAGQLRRRGLEATLHVAGRRLSRAGVVEVLEAARGFGVRSLFVVQGDSSSHLEQDDADCDFPYASDLVKFIREKYDRYFLIGVAGYPEKHPQSKNLEQDIEYLKLKVSSGADFIITQACLDFDTISAFARRCRAEDIRAPIIAGLFVVTSRASLDALEGLGGVAVPQDVRDALQGATVRESGVDLAARMAGRILGDREGLLQGFHLFTMNDLGVVEGVLGPCEVDKEIKNEKID